MKSLLIIDNPQDIFRAPAEQGFCTDASVGALFEELSRKYELILTCTQTDDVSRFVAFCDAYKAYLKHVSIAPPSYQPSPGFSHENSAIISECGELHNFYKTFTGKYIHTRLPSLSSEFPQQIASRMLIYSNIEELYADVMRLIRFSPGLMPVVAQAKPKTIVVGRTFISAGKFFKLQSRFPGIEYIAACMDHTDSPAFLKHLIGQAESKLTESIARLETPFASSDDDTISRTSPSSSGGGSPRLLHEGQPSSLGKDYSSPPQLRKIPSRGLPSPIPSPERPFRIPAATSCNDVSGGPPVGDDPGSAFRRSPKSLAQKPRAKTKICAVM